MSGNFSHFSLISIKDVSLHSWGTKHIICSSGDRMVLTASFENRTSGIMCFYRVLSSKQLGGMNYHSLASCSSWLDSSVNLEPLMCMEAGGGWLTIELSVMSNLTFKKKIQRFFKFQIWFRIKLMLLKINPSLKKFSFFFMLFGYKILLLTYSLLNLKFARLTQDFSQSRFITLWQDYTVCVPE